MPPSFSRRTVLAAVDVLNNFTQNELGRFLLEYNLDGIAGIGAVLAKTNNVSRHLLANPDAFDDDGQNLTDTIVRSQVEIAIQRSQGFGGFSPQLFQQNYPLLNRGLARDGFTVDDGNLRRTLPADLNLPATDDEVHKLLNHFAFNTPLGHLDQGIAAHARGEWAAANAQFRPFVESLFDEIAERLAAGAVIPAPGNARRIWLSQLNPPFLLIDLNEWSANGTGFLEGFYRRLHPQGAHPGLSDEEDSTFRYHLVLLVARLLLRRLRDRLQNP